jgi:lipopolysaccharide export system permease protein
VLESRGFPDPNDATRRAMNLMTRYVLWELVKVFVVTVIGMTAVMMLIGVVQEAIQQNLTPLTILQLIPFLVPQALFFAIPATMLFGTCNVFARMSAANEVIALKAAGCSPMVVVWPAVIFAFLLSLLTVILNDVAVSWGREGVYRVIMHSVEKTIYAVLNADQKFTNGRLTFAVQDIEGRDLYGLTVEKFAEKSSQGFRLSAQQARLACNPASNKLEIWIKNGTFQAGDDTVAVIDDGVLPIDLSDATRKSKSGEASPSAIPLRAIPVATYASQMTLTHKRRDMAMSAAFQMLGGNFVGLTHPAWTPQFENLRELEIRGHRLAVEPWRRWANGFSCLCFVVVGAPLALRMHSSDFWVVFFVCFLPILVAYYPLLMFGISQTKTGYLPPLFVWTANVVMLFVGWRLLRKLETQE